MKKRIIFLVYIFLLFSGMAKGQQGAIKTNLLHLSSATLNAALEVGTGRNTSLELYAGYNGFVFRNDKRWKHWIAQPELRWWFCERFNGHYLGVHFHGGQFNAGYSGPFKTLKNHRYEGYFYGTGVSYGHQWIVSNRWAIDLTIGLGYARVEYDKYDCGVCTPKVKSGSRNYVGPTKLQASIQLFLW